VSDSGIETLVVASAPYVAQQPVLAFPTPFDSQQPPPPPPPSLNAPGSAPAAAASIGDNPIGTAIQIVTQVAASPMPATPMLSKLNFDA
jgi:hypothetical protein